MQNVNDRIKDEPKRFSRCIDAFFLSDLIYIICKDNLYNKFFKDPFVETPRASPWHLSIFRAELDALWVNKSFP